MPYTLVRQEDIGGGKVERGFTSRGRVLKTGDILTAAELRAMPAANRQALIDKRYVSIFPVLTKADHAERLITKSADGKTYDVIEGSKVGEGLTLAQAKLLASDSK